MDHSKFAQSPSIPCTCWLPVPNSGSKSVRRRLRDLAKNAQSRNEPPTRAASHRELWGFRELSQLCVCVVFAPSKEENSMLLPGNRCSFAREPGDTGGHIKYANVYEAFACPPFLPFARSRRNVCRQSSNTAAQQTSTNKNSFYFSPWQLKSSFEQIAAYLNMIKENIIPASSDLESI